MHRPWLRYAALAGLLAAGLAGCRAPAGGPLLLADIRDVYVTDTTAAPDARFEGLGHAVHDASVRELRRRGYVATVTPDEAQAFVRSSWRRRQSDSPHPDRDGMQLSIGIFDREGRRLFEADSGPALSGSFWNEARASDEVVRILGKLPPPTSLTPAR